MKLSTSWAKDWLRRTISDDQIVAALERAGLEVEQFISPKSIDKKVVVALVKKVIQHPAADRLRLVDVTTGEREVRVVCGAPNVREGLKVALAQVGSTLPSGDVISSAKLRGEVSEGMLCSELELGLGSNHEGILELPADVEVGVSLCDIYPTDGIVDLKTHANRFDLLSVAGLAREIAAMTDEKLKDIPEPLAPQADAADKYIAKDLSRTARFMLVDLRLEVDAPSPDWMVSRLRTAGVRAISLVVDVTNYVNLELGQPLHAYDAAKVKLPLEVRQARVGERLVTLDGVERELTEQDLVVADAKGPVGLAGLMGGAGTEVDENTREILLEAATFDAPTVRKMAKRHGLRTEASARFERGLSQELPPIALTRAVALLKELAGAEMVAVADRQADKPADRGGIDLPMELLNRLLGFQVTAAEAVRALGRLQLEAREARDVVSVPVLPWWRPDLREAQDLIEEIVRVLGLERVSSTLPQWRPRRLEFDRFRPRQRLLQSALYGAGLFEVMTYSFVSEDQLTGLGLPKGKHLKLKNPLSTEQAYLRSSLLPSHLMVLSRNRTYAKEIGFYELSKVFVKRGRGEQPDEPLRLAVTLMRPEEAYRHVKGVLDLVARELGVKLTVEPAASLPGFADGRGARVMLEGREIGGIGQLDPELLARQKIGGEAAYLELDAGEILTAAQTRQFAGLERFPRTGRDLSVLVPEKTTWQDVAQVLEGLPNTSVNFVSDYHGEELPEGRKSLALRLVVSHPDRTPTEAEAAEVEKKALAILKRKFGAEQRI